MQKVISRLLFASVFSFLIFAVFFGGRMVFHSMSGAWFNMHQMQRILIVTGGFSVILFLTRMLLSIREMNFHYRESSRWS